MGLSALRLGYTQPIEENVADPDLVADAIEVVADQLGGVDPRTVEVAPRTVGNCVSSVDQVASCLSRSAFI
jgi:chemotaxis receptor (MCP) glutamine deamidase CheD